MRRISFYLTCGVLALFSICVGCAHDVEEVEPKPTPQPQPEEEQFELKRRQDIMLTSVQKEGIEVQNDFAFRLFEADRNSTDKNTLISPLSLTQGLSMIANGTEEEVKKEIVENLFSKEGCLNDLNNLNKYLVEALIDVDNSSIISVANSAWVDKNYKILSPFADEIKEYYNANSKELDFSSSTAVDTINEWVYETTNGLIPTLFDVIPPTYKLILVNTMYFNGAWLSPFDKKLTKNSIFHNETGKTVEVEFMNHQTYFSHAITSDYSVLQLPYGNRAFSFYAILPSEGKSVELTSTKWNEMKKVLSGGSEVIVSMPKFEVQYEVPKVSEKINNAGISKLFNTKCALKNMVTPEVPESYVEMIHKTLFKVNESGAEGAGLTGLGLSFLGDDDMETPKTPEIILDRPFIYIVEEKSTGAILFIGAIRNL